MGQSPGPLYLLFATLFDLCILPRGIVLVEFQISRKYGSKKKLWRFTTEEDDLHGGGGGGGGDGEKKKRNPIRRKMFYKRRVKRAKVRHYGEDASVVDKSYAWLSCGMLGMVFGSILSQIMR